MGKRNSPVILSSDDEYNGGSLSSNRSFSKPKTKAVVTRTNPRTSKRPRRSGSRYSLRSECSNINEVKFFDEDFDDFFSRSKVSTGFERSNIKELWVDKYKPRSLDELSVHKKKVEEVKAWFEERLKTSEGIGRNHLLVITGQAGVGKSTAIHAIASHFGARLCEWSAPTPTIWQEHVHNASTGIQYTSKLDEFINFIEKIRKYGLIPSSFLEESRKSIILLIDDLPVTTGRVAFEKLQECLLLLARSTLIPTVILVTDYGKADSADSTSRWSEELLLSLENAGACKVSFNPITNNSIKKALTRICRLEQCNATADQIDLIANASGGDIRHAILSLQFFSVKPDVVTSLPISPNSSHNSDKMVENINDLVGEYSLLFGRDETLSLFHALGKFLHNKREAEVAVVSGPNECILQGKFSRLTMKMDDPEKVLCQAHGQSRPIADFLHENVLDFISEEGMDDAWDVASYLSDADLLLSSIRGMLSRTNEIDNVLQSAAASVAVRGVLFGNSNPLSSRWHAIRKPKLWQAGQSLLRNQKEMIKRRFIAHGGCSSSELSVVATEYSPMLKWLEYRASDLGESKGHKHSIRDEMDEESFEMMNLDDEDSQNSEDEIEDW